MQEEKRETRFFSYFKKIVIALGVAALFFILSLFPSLSYFGEAETSVLERAPTGFWLVRASCNITYNPFLFSLSWLRGVGSLSNLTFDFVSIPQYGGGELKVPMWRSSQELADDAILKLVLSQLFINLLYNFGLIFVIEFMKLRKLYFCLIGGIIGFPIGGIGGFPFGATMGAVIGFIIGILMIVFVIPRLKRESAFVTWLDSLWRRGLKDEPVS